MSLSKLASALILIAAAGAAHAAIPKNIALTGADGTAYCDTLNGLTKTTAGVTGTWDAACDGTNAVIVGGIQGKAAGAASKGYLMGSQGLAALYGLEVFWVVNADQTWSLYTLDGALVNNGTWSKGGALAQGGKRLMSK